MDVGCQDRYPVQRLESLALSGQASKEVTVHRNGGVLEGAKELK